MTRSFGSQSSDDDSIRNQTNKIKFLYSYGGKIVPRRTDGMLRYAGGFTRVLAVDRTITFSELIVKFGELCGSSMNLKCKLPTEDLDVLISITCDEDLTSVIGEYDRVSLATHQEMKIRAVLFLAVKSPKQVSPPLSPVSVIDYSPSYKVIGSYAVRPKAWNKCGCQIWSPSPACGYPIGGEKDSGKLRRYACCEKRIPRPRQSCTISHGNNWK